MYNFQKYIDAACGDTGYYIGHLTNKDVKVFQNIVGNQYQQILKSYESIFSKKIVDINSYHTLDIAKSSHHKKLWPKKNRILTQERFEEIKKTNFFTDLDKQLEWYEITDEEKSGWGEVYFRLCRPAPYVDVGPLHADAWFWELGHGKIPYREFSTKRVKIWFCLHADGDKTGFKFADGSHKKSYNYSGESRDGFVKPTFDESKYDLNIKSLKGNIGTFIVFNDCLIHSGEVLKSSTRVSLEFTLEINNK